MAQPSIAEFVTLRTPTFAIDLPLGWTSSEHADRTEFNAPDAAEQVIVSVLTARAVMSAEERAAVVEEIFDSRQRSLVELAEGSGILLPAAIEHTDEASTLAYVGTDFANRVLMYGRIVARGSRIIVASYYRYALECALVAFVSRAQAACGSVRDIAP